MLIGYVLLTFGFVLFFYWLFLIHVVLRTLIEQFLTSGINVIASGVPSLECRENVLRVLRKTAAENIAAIRLRRRLADVYSSAKVGRLLNLNVSKGIEFMPFMYI